MPLGFVEEPYPAAQQAELLHSFRTRGYMVLPDVFADAASVAEFRQRVVEKAVAGASVGAEPSAVYPLPSDSPEMVALRLHMPSTMATICGSVGCPTTSTPPERRSARCPSMMMPGTISQIGSFAESSSPECPARSARQHA